MAEFTNAALQTVAAGANVQFTETPIPCCKGYVMHREGSGVVTLRGATAQNRARYRVSFGGNLAVPTGGTVGPVAVALALNGEALGSATGIVTPAAVEEFFNVYVEAYIDVPCGCCLTVAVRNIGTEPIDVQNANLIVDRVA